MEEQADYGAKCVASSPETFKVGEEVCIKEFCQVGVVTAICEDGSFNVWCKDDDNYSANYEPEELRKFPAKGCAMGNSQEFKIGDIVEILVGLKDVNIVGNVVGMNTDGTLNVECEDACWSDSYEPRQLRKITDAEKLKEEQKEVAMGDKPLNKQVGGEHYDMPIQPVEFIHKNGLGFVEGCIIKYIARYKRKGGKGDLLKAKHYIELLIQMEYPEDEKD